MKQNRLKICIILAVVIVVFVGCQNQNISMQSNFRNLEIKNDIKNKINDDFRRKLDKLVISTDASEIVYDKSKNLTWQDNIETVRMELNWNDAKLYCKNLKFKNHNNWTLPTLIELKTIFDENEINKHKKWFKNTSSHFYWTSTENSSYSSSVFSVDFSYPTVTEKYKEDKAFVRCVRKGRTSILTFENIEKYNLYKSGNGTKQVVSHDSYFQKPFEEISKITQQLTTLYLESRKIPKSILTKIEKPNLPQLPKFIKDEYETKVMFQKRVNAKIRKREKKIKNLQLQYRKDVENRNQIITKLSKKIESEQKYKKLILSQKIAEFQKGAFEIIMGGFKFEKRSYDAETSTMYMNMKANRANYSKKVSLKVSPKNAKHFSDNIINVKADPRFKFTKNQITLSSIDAIYNRDRYLIVLNDKNFVPDNIEVSIKDNQIEFDSTQQMRFTLQNPNLKDTFQVETLSYKDGKEIKGQNFDDDIPDILSKVSSTKIDSTKWLFIIGIENYSETDDIKYSKRSAELFKKVAQKTLGIKERNSYTLINSKATGTAIKNKLRLLLSEVKKGDTVYFYYNGHGIPNPAKNGEPYILPSDGIPDFIVSESEFSLKNIYKQLSDSKAKKVVAFVDSCFSGATDGVSIIKGVAGSRLAPKRVIFNKSKMVVLAAGQKKQYSNMYKEKGHRMFSYFVMQSLLDGKKDINMLYKEVSYKVSEASNELGALKKQEPTLDGNSKIRL